MPRKSFSYNLIIEMATVDSKHLLLIINKAAAQTEAFPGLPYMTNVAMSRVVGWVIPGHVSVAD